MPDLVVGCSAGALVGSLYAAGLFELLMQSFEIMSSSIMRLELREADVVVQGDLGKLSFTDFTSRHLLITLGEQAARRALPAIRSKLRLG